MIEVAKFRTAVGGFHRTDVVNYIEALSVEHQKELRKYQDEAKRMQTENQTLQQQLDAASEELTVLREQDASLQEQVSVLAQEATEAVQRCNEAEQQLAELRTMLPTEEEAEPEDGSEEQLSLCDRELIAYRRAEQTERNAILRANKIFGQIADLTDSTRSRYMDAGEDIAALTEDLKCSLERLQDALAELQVIFDDTTGAFEDMDLPAVSDAEE